ERAIDGLRGVSALDYVPRGLLARATLRRAGGDWTGATLDFDEVEEICGAGPFRLYLCDVALERARLAFARIEAFAPLQYILREGPPAQQRPSAAEIETLMEEAGRELAVARNLISKCGYHRRDEELAELEAVLRRDRLIADLLPRI